MADVKEFGNNHVFTIEDKCRKTNIAASDNMSAVPFEDALDMTGMGRYNYVLFMVGGIALLASALESFGTGYVVSASVCDLQLTTETKGLIAAVPMMGIVLSSHMWGWLADTRGRRTVLLVSMFGSFIGAVVSSFSNSWLMLALIKFIATFFASASNAVTYALLGECTPRTHRNKLIMLLSSCLFFGQGVMTLNAYPILHLDFDIPLFFGIRYKPWRLLEQVFGAWSGLAAILLLLVTKESPKFYASLGKEEQSLQVMRYMYSVNTGKKPEEFPVKSLSFQETLVSGKKTNFIKSMWDQTTPLFRRPLLKDSLVLIYLVIAIYAISPAFLLWMPSITDAYSRATATGADLSFCKLLQMEKAPTFDSFNSTVVAPPKCIDKVEDFTFLMLFLFSSAIAILNTMNSYIIKYTGKRFLVILLHVIGGLCGIFLPFAKSTLSLVAFFLFQTNLMAMSLTTGFTVEIYPTYLRAMAVCLTMMIGRGSSFIVISYIGVLIETHCDEMFYAFGGFILSGAFVALLLPPERKKDDREKLPKEA